MNTNKYNLFFYASRIITLMIILFLIFCIVNIKYSISENFFEVLASVFISSFDRPIMKFLTIYPFYFLFVHFIKYVFLFMLSLIVIIFFLKKFFSKEIIIYLLIVLINTFVITIIVDNIAFPFNKLFFVIVMLLFSCFLFFINFYKQKNSVIKILCLIPIIGDFVLPNHVFNKKNIILSITILTLFIDCCMLLFSPFRINKFYLSRNNKLQIINAKIHSLNIDNLNRVITKYENGFIILEDVSNNKSIRKIKCETWTQNVYFNKYDECFYIYDEFTGKLIVFDRDFNILKSKQIIEDIKDIYSAERISFGNDNHCVVLLEKGFFCLVNTSSLDVEKIFRLKDYSDHILYNEFLSSYMVGFWHSREYFVAYSLKHDKVYKIKSPKMQGFFAISKRNKELYLAFHQKGRIYVYDAETLKLKRKIKTQYSVRNIFYDEELNVLISPGTFTGYVDIFFMDGSDALLCSEYIDFEIRDAKFDNTKQYLFVTSELGLYKKKLDIVDLIEKYKKNNL